MTRSSSPDPLQIDPLVTDIVDTAYRRPQPTSTETIAALLLDFLANAHRRGAVGPLLHSPRLETIGLAAAAAHHHDLDDVHWPTLTHPGSIVWPGVLAYGASHCNGRQVMRAATVGYDVTAEVAGLIAAAGIDRWHRTALAGHAGASAAAALTRGFDDRQCARAVALSLTVAGGVGQTIAERSPAGGFHRACAARNGAAAVDFTAAGVTAPLGVLSGPAGLIAACGGSLPARAATGVNQRPAIEQSTIRVYPTNGFAQAAVAATVRARRRFDDPVADISVEVHPAVIAQFRAPPASRHWDLLATVRNAWSTGDPWTVDRQDLDPRTVTATLQEHDGLAVGDAQVTVRAGSDELTVRVDSDFSHPHVEMALALEKWSRQGAVRPDERHALLTGWLSSDEIADPQIFSVGGADDTDRSLRR